MMNLSLSEATNTEYLSNEGDKKKANENDEPERVEQLGYKKQIKTLDQEAETDVSMFDVQITLEHKYRSVAKIKQLEELVEMQKMQLNEYRNKLALEMEK